MAKRIELTESGVIFDEIAHSYELNGKILSGITGPLQRQLGISYDGIDENVLQAATDYGHQVHKSCELFDRQWVNDGTAEVWDYIQIVQKNNLIHEASEFTVTDGENYASNIDKIYRTGDNTFALADIKTYGSLNAEKMEYMKFQLSIYAYLFELQNKKCKVEQLFVIRLRNREKSNGEIDRRSELIPVKRIPAEICKDLLQADLEGKKFVSPFGIPMEIAARENEIKELIQQKAIIEEKLNKIKEKILNDMRLADAKSWITETMKLTRKLPSTRITLDSKLLKVEHPEIDYSRYEKVSQVSDSLLITV